MIELFFAQNLTKFFVFTYTIKLCFVGLLGPCRRCVAEIAEFMICGTNVDTCWLEKTKCMFHALFVGVLHSALVYTICH